MGFGNLFDDQAVEPSSPLYWALGVVFLVLLVGSLYVWLRGQRLYAEDRFHRRLADRYAGLFAIFSAIGLMAALFSLLAVPFLSKRIWLVLAVLGFAATAAHLAYYVRRRYRRDLESHLNRERRQRSIPRPKSGGRKRRGKRR
jgi:uncharacterized membrane protein